MTQLTLNLWSILNNAFGVGVNIDDGYIRSAMYIVAIAITCLVAIAPLYVAWKTFKWVLDL